ncbi:MAG TPA: alpha/beta hydrolase [Dehalococcoidia bacterium]|nr:alpha/beta hydrolase [Dehalococcoidia bacterium]
MTRPSLLLIHGAASGAWVWDLWRRNLGELDWQVNVLDLRGHGRSLSTDLSAVTMEDYVADIASVTTQIERAQGIHPIVGGWSMGGMLAMMYAKDHPETSAIMLLEPTNPKEIAGRAPAEVQRKFAGSTLSPESFGVFSDDAERSREVLFDLTDDEVTGFLTHSQGALESGIAFRQNLRGISIPEGSIASPCMVVYGDTEGRQDARDWGMALAAHLHGEALPVPGAGHWGLVAHEETVKTLAPAVDRWLRSVFTEN